MNFIDAVDFFYKEGKRFNKIDIKIVNGCNINHLAAYLDEKSYCPEVAITENNGRPVLTISRDAIDREKYNLEDLNEISFKNKINDKVTSPITQDIYMNSIEMRRQLMKMLLDNRSELKKIEDHDCTSYFIGDDEMFVIYKKLPYSTYNDINKFEYRDGDILKSSYFSEITDYEDFINRVLNRG